MENLNGNECSKSKLLKFRILINHSVFDTSVYRTYESAKKRVEYLKSINEQYSYVICVVEMPKQTHPKIGEKGYILDNSYIQHLNDPNPHPHNSHYLAGTIFSSPLPVTVLTEPFIDNESGLEFILVSYDNNVYRVLNQWQGY